jgi:hypothetical protein
MGNGDSWLGKFMMYFGMLMVAIYIGLGVVLMFVPVFEYIPKNMRVIFGIFFLMYGLLRSTRIYQKFKNNI